MSTWPNIGRPHTIDVSVNKAQIRSSFESGYVSSYPKWTRTRKIFTLTWTEGKLLSVTNLTALITFFENNQGGTFTWTHPITNTSYTVRFSEDGFSYTFAGVPNHASCEVKLEEQ